MKTRISQSTPLTAGNFMGCAARRDRCATSGGGLSSRGPRDQGSASASESGMTSLGTMSGQERASRRREETGAVVQRRVRRSISAGRRRRRRAHLLPLAVARRARLRRRGRRRPTVRARMSARSPPSTCVIGRGRTSRPCTACSTRHRDTRMDEAAFARAYRRVRRHRDADRGAPRTGATAARASGCGGDAHAHASVRHPGRGPGGACLHLVDRDLRALRAHPAVPGVARGRAPHPRRGHARPGRPAGQRRDAAGPRAPPGLPDPRRRRGDRGRTRPDPGAAGGTVRRARLPALGQGRARWSGAHL